MLRYRTSVSLSDRVAGIEVASRCGVKPLLQVMPESSLRWFEHVKRRTGVGVLREVMEMEVTGTKPRGRPNKVWMMNIEEDLCELNLTQYDAYGRERWEAVKKRQTQ